MTTDGAAATAVAPTAVDTAARFERLARLLLRRARAGRVDGLTPSQSSVLQTVRESGPLPLRDLARLEAVTPPTASRAVDLLVQRDLLAVQVDPADGRRHLIRMTPSGDAVLDARLGGTVSALATGIAGLEPGRRDALQEALPALDALVDVLARD